jgi:light-harvesting complex 1 alpha chain
MWKVWLLFDPRRALIAVGMFAFTMVMLMHFIVLSSPRYGDFLGWGGQQQLNTKPASK